MTDPVAAMAGWATKCSEEEGALDSVGVVTTTGSTTKCTAKEAVLYGTGIEITTLSSVNSTVKVLYPCLHYVCGHNRFG